MAAMLSVDPKFRGVASGFQTMLLMFGQILALITLFGILTHSVDEAQLFALFLYGGGGESIFIIIAVSPLLTRSLALAINFFDHIRHGSSNKSTSYLLLYCYGVDGGSGSRAYDI